MAKQMHGGQSLLGLDLPPATAAELAARKLTDKWLEPPFSVLNAGSERWQERKRAWVALGIQSELGRGENTLGLSGEANEAARYDKDAYRARQNISIDGGPIFYHRSGDEPFVDDEKMRLAKKASPGGSPRPAATLGKDGKTVRGDGAGRGFARTYGQDIMRGEYKLSDFSKSGAVIPAGGGGMADRLANNDRDGKPFAATYGAAARSDEVSRKIMASGPLVKTHTTGTQDRCRDNIEQDCAQNHSGTSIFDPVLTETMYYWFCPPHGLILDPFAGGSVRGIVAARLRRRYVGIELRPEQAEANREQWERIKRIPDQHGKTDFPEPVWIVGDSLDLSTLVASHLNCGSVDFLFSCPPYFNLEVYSNDPRDLSTMDWPTFSTAYASIIGQGVTLLKPNRFSAFVVGDIRDTGHGRYRRFPNLTAQCFEDAGAWFHNEIILYTAIGSGSIRAPKQFAASRKCVKTHQNVYSFCKGNDKLAAQAMEN